MTRDDIIRMALEALDYEAEKSFDADAWLDIRKALREMLAQPEQEHIIDCPRCGHCCPADSIAAAERERIIAENAPVIERINAHIKALEDAVAAEREACAKVCDEQQELVGAEMCCVAMTCAAAIRARGEK